MRVHVGQRWEVHRPLAPDDPLVLEVIEVDERFCRTRSYLHSAPRKELDRSSGRCRDLLDTGVLVAGPGAPAPSERRKQVALARDLLQYAASHEGRRSSRGIAVAAGPLEEMVTGDVGDRDYARMIVREAVSAIGGVEDDVLVDESTGFFGTTKRHQRCYVIAE